MSEVSPSIYHVNKDQNFTIDSGMSVIPLLCKHAHLRLNLRRFNIYVIFTTNVLKQEEKEGLKDSKINSSSRQEE